MTKNINLIRSTTLIKSLSGEDMSWSNKVVTPAYKFTYATRAALGGRPPL